MHPCLSEWPSNMFYEGTLQNGVTEGERVMDQVSRPVGVPRVPRVAAPFWKKTGAARVV